MGEGMGAQERRIGAAALELKRQVNGDLAIKKFFFLSPPPPPTSIPNPQHSLHIPFPAKPFSNFSARQHPPPLFSSFADLFKNTSPPSASVRGILPLPANLKPLSPSEGEWISVVNKKKAWNLRSAALRERPVVSVKKERCFFCGNPSHMAKECKIGSFLCFKCKEVTSRSCPLTYQPPSRPIPMISLPQTVKDNISQRASIAIFSLKSGDLSVTELKEMLVYVFNVKEWEEQIIPATKGSFLIEFPSSELLDRAISTPYVDMDSFGGSFAKWNESKGLHVFTEPVFVWVHISSLPFHLWDSSFFSQLFKGNGQVHTYSRDILLKEEARDCNVLLKVKCRQDIPSSIPFRYISPSSNWLMEGNAGISVLGKAVTASELQSDEGGLFVMQEGEPSSNFRIGAFCKSLFEDNVVNQPRIRPFMEDDSAVAAPQVSPKALGDSPIIPNEADKAKRIGAMQEARVLPDGEGPSKLERDL